MNKDGEEVVLKKREFIFDNGTFRGRINIAMRHLRDVFPGARIVLLTPIHRGYAKFGDRNVQPDESYSNKCGLFVDDYVAAVKEAGNIWAVRVVDINSDSGIYPNSRSQDAFIANPGSDRLHPSTAGHERIAEAISIAVGPLL